MDTSILSRDIQDLSLELLLTSNASAGGEAVTAALLKLGEIVQKAQTAGATNVANSADKLLESVDAVKDKLPAKDLLPLIVDGLKSLGGEAELSQSRSAPASAPAAPNILGQDRELLQDFVLEALEHLSVVEAQLLVLEENPDDREPTHACFRAIHTIKGVAGFLELNRIREVAHEGETLLDGLRNGKLVVTPETIDTLLETEDFLRKEVAAIEASLAGESRSDVPDYRNLIIRLRSARSQPSGAEPGRQVPEPAPETRKDTPPIPVARPEVTERPTIESQPPNSVHHPAPTPSPKAKTPPAAANGARSVEQKAHTTAGRSVKVDMEKLDYLADMVGELVVTQSMLRLEGIAKSSADTPLTRNLTQLARITAEVQKTTMSMRMIQIGQLFQRLARVVRDVSRQAAKTIELDISGDEIELDRSIVEELADPLMHMVRNSIDHGIETPEQRTATGKSPTGIISLKARHEAGQVHISVSDDGRGLDRERILAKACERGLIESNAVLSDNEIFNLIFEPGFSTAEKVTDLSGRGVGMDVVRKQIQKLRGRVELHSTPGKGSTFVLRLPLTLAIIDGLVVRVGGERYIVPLGAVREVLQPGGDMIFTVQGREEMAMIRQTLLPVTRLYRWMNVKPGSENLSASILIVIEGQNRSYCLAVDELLGKQEVVIKSLGAFMQSISGIAGGAILGDGHIGLILDPEAFARRPARG
jgi:two-component system chemotaxis sensor kinase CheA